MNASEPSGPLDSDVQILQVTVPHITRAYPFRVPRHFRQHYSSFYSQNLQEPPTGQGIPGDFYIGVEHIFLKDGQSRWKVAHFSRPVSHPFLDDVFLCYDAWGPLWTRSPLPPCSPSSDWLPIPVSLHFYSTLTLAHRQRAHLQRGNDPDDPILVND